MRMLDVLAKGRFIMGTRYRNGNRNKTERKIKRVSKEDWKTSIVEFQKKQRIKSQIQQQILKNKYLI